MKKLQNNQKGQALITLLFFVAISTIVTTAAVVILFDNSLNVLRFTEGTESYYGAESGIENALLRIIRNPLYTGETMNFLGEEISIVVTNNSGIYTITSTGKIGDSSRAIEAIAEYQSGTLTVTSWNEIY